MQLRNRTTGRWAVRRRRRAAGRGLVSAATALVAILCGGRAGATTIVPVTFDDMVRASGSIVVARVTDARTTEVQSPGYRPPKAVGGPADTRAPMGDTSSGRAGAPASQDLPAPISAGIKPGRVIFTHLTLLVEETIKGRSPSVLHLKVPGGSHRGTTMVVHGLPAFVTGERYLLFLRPQADRLGDPVVGVNQGHFRVIAGSPGESEAIVNGAGDYIIAVEDRRVVVKAGPGRAARRPAPALGPVPEPDMGFPSEPILSEAERRYWESDEPPLTIRAMAALVRAVPGWDQPAPPGRPGAGPWRVLPGTAGGAAEASVGASAGGDAAGPAVLR